MTRRHLPRAGAGADRHQVGHVHTSDDQDDENAAPEQQQRPPAAFDEILLKVPDSRRELRVEQDRLERREPLEVLRVDGVDLRLRLLDARARLEPAHLLPVVAVPLRVGALLGSEGRRGPQLNLGIDESPPLRHHADDHERVAIDPQVLPHGIIAAGKQPLPQPVAQNDLALLSDLGIGLGKQPAAMRLGAQQAEERRRHRHAREPLGIALSLAANRHAGGAIHRELFERGHAGQPIEVVGNAVRRALDAGAGIGIEDRGNALGLGKRQRPQHDGIDDGENRGVGGEAE